MMLSSLQTQLSNLQKQTKRVLQDHGKELGAAFRRRHCPSVAKGQALVRWLTAIRRAFDTHAKALYAEMKRQLQDGERVKCGHHCPPELALAMVTGTGTDKKSSLGAGSLYGASRFRQRDLFEDGLFPPDELLRPAGEQRLFGRGRTTRRDDDYLFDLDPLQSPVSPLGQVRPAMGQGKKSGQTPLADNVTRPVRTATKVIPKKPEPAKEKNAAEPQVTFSDKDQQKQADL